MDKNFNDIYQSIYDSAMSEMTALTKRKNDSLILLIVMLVFTIISFIMFADKLWIMTVALFCSFAAVAFFALSSFNYKTRFKSLIMRKIVEEYHPSFEFYPKNGVSAIDYKRSDFDNFYESFYTEDLIMGQIAEKYKIKMSQVKTTKTEIVRDSNGDTHRKTVVVFYGIFGVVDIGDKNISELDISANSFFNKYDQDRIEIDSGDFEKRYDLFSTDKVRAMEIFTSELIEEINKLKEDTGHTIQIRIRANKLFFRIACGEAFEAPIIRNAVDYNLLYQYYRMIDAPIDIITKLLENADNTER